jgi:RHS repeat-associated protein
VNNYRYTGQQWDSDLGMYYLRARYLNPQTGRFWTMDSFEGGSSDPLSLHKYTYCQNNPPNLVDPTGHYSSYEQVLGYDAEEAIQDLYVQQHPGDKISLSKREFRKDNPLRWLFPDIYNRTQSKWLEVKPLSPTG